MIPKKSLNAPAGTHRELYFTPKELRTRASSYFLEKFREVNGALVLTEGKSALSARTMNETVAIGCVWGSAPNGEGYTVFYLTTAGDYQVSYMKGRFTMYGKMPKVKRFLKYYVPDVGVMLIGVAPRNHIFVQPWDQTVFSIELKEGGTCGAIHCERLFTAEGDQVRYSALHDPREIKLKRDSEANAAAVTETVQGPGWFRMFNSRFGDIVEMASYAEHLYFFREHGVTRLTGGADATEFRLEDLRIKGYKAPISESLVVCDGRIFYFSTDDKLCSFDGEKVTEISDPATAHIDFSANLHAELGGGRYYCMVTRTDGVQCVYCYDPVSGAGFFFGKDVTIGEELLYVLDKEVSTFSGCGYISITDKTSILETTFAPTPDKALLLEGVAVEGAGNFTVTLSGEEERRTFAATGGKYVHLTAPLRVKELTVRLESNDNVSVCVKGIRLLGTEVAYAD